MDSNNTAATNLMTIMTMNMLLNSQQRSRARSASPPRRSAQSLRSPRRAPESSLRNPSAGRRTGSISSIGSAMRGTSPVIRPVSPSPLSVASNSRTAAEQHTMPGEAGQPEQSGKDGQTSQMRLFGDWLLSCCGPSTDGRGRGTWPPGILKFMAVCCPFLVFARAQQRLNDLDRGGDGLLEEGPTPLFSKEGRLAGFCFFCCFACAFDWSDILVEQRNHARDFGFPDPDDHDDDGDGVRACVCPCAFVARNERELHKACLERRQPVVATPYTSQPAMVAPRPLSLSLGYVAPGSPHGLLRPSSPAGSRRSARAGSHRSRLEDIEEREDREERERKFVEERGRGLVMDMVEDTQRINHMSHRDGEQADPAEDEMEEQKGDRLGVDSGAWIHHNAASTIESFVTAESTQAVRVPKAAAPSEGEMHQSEDESEDDVEDAGEDFGKAVGQYDSRTWPLRGSSTDSERFSSLVCFRVDSGGRPARSVGEGAAGRSMAHD